MCKSLEHIIAHTHTHTILWLDSHEYARIRIPCTNWQEDKWCNVLKHTENTSVQPAWECVCTWTYGMEVRERLHVCQRKNRRPRACVYDRVRDRQRVAGAGKAVCTVRTVHMAVCTCPQLCFYEEPSTSFHSSGGSLRPPEPQWARVPLSVSISSSSHLFRTRALVLSRCSKAERDSSGTEM